MDTSLKVATQVVVLIPLSIKTTHSQQEGTQRLNITRSAVRRTYQRYEIASFLSLNQHQEEFALQMNEMIVLLPQQLYKAVG